MPSLHIRDLPDEALSGLKRRARRHGRSLQAEVRMLLSEAALLAPADATEARLDLKLAEGEPATPSTWSREEIYADDAP